MKLYKEKELAFISSDHRLKIKHEELFIDKFFLLIREIIFF